MSDNMSNKMINNGEILLSNELEKNQIYKFEDIEEIKENLLRGIFSCDFDYPSELQSYVLKSMFNKKDIFIQSNAGTGKTTACVITSLQVIDESVNKPQVLILNPRTELALCSYNSIKKIATYLMTEDNFLLAIGGTNRKDNILKMGGIVENEKSDIDNVAKIVLGTFGRIDDLISNYPHLFDSIKLLIVDDCDEIINCCLLENFQSILTKLKNGYQLCMLTTSLSEETKTIVNNLMANSLHLLKFKMPILRETFLL
jgi:superfamily II DNA/RNA helicase